MLSPPNQDYTLTVSRLNRTRFEGDKAGQKT